MLLFAKYTFPSDVVDSALNYIRNKQQEQHQKRLDSDSASDNNDDDGQLTKETGRQTVF